MTMKQYLQHVFLILLATHVIGYLCIPIPFEDQNLIKRNPMRGEQEQHSTQPGTSTNSVRRPGRQRYRKFDSVTVTPSHQTVQQSHPQRQGYEHHRPTPIHTGRYDRFHTGASHSTYHTSSIYSGSNISPSRQSNNLAGRIAGSVVGAVGEGMVMNAVGMRPDIVTTYNHGRPQTSVGYSAGINHGGNNPNNPSSPGCVGCVSWLFSGDSGYNSS